ncbi:MAG: hypothetical protein AAB689_02075 [Patescibacteria group bacterium]
MANTEILNLFEYLEEERMRSIILYLDDQKSTAAATAVNEGEVRGFLAGESNGPLRIIEMEEEEDEDY